MTTGPTTETEEARWMQQALDLARRGEGRTRPNPPVGAVVVQGDRSVGSGYHHAAGQAHAEVHAIQAAGKAAAGATLYVTLEPCCTQGRTPPCTDLIQASGIKRVVVTVRDPNPRHAGRGLRILRRAGIAVRSGVLREQGRALIAPFAMWVEHGRPFVTLKMAMTLDGRIADARGRSRWISSAPSRREVERLRRRADVVMVGSGTASIDDPALLCRQSVNTHYRVIVDSAGRLKTTARVLRDKQRHMTVIATTERCPVSRRAAYGKRGAEVLVLPSRGGRVSLKALLRELGRRGMLHVVCEGGAGLAHALLDEKLVDECWFFVAPRIMGDSGALPVVKGKGWPLADARRFAFKQCAASGPDILLKAVASR